MQVVDVLVCRLVGDAEFDDLLVPDGHGAGGVGSLEREAVLALVDQLVALVVVADDVVVVVEVGDAIAGVAAKDGYACGCVCHADLLVWGCRAAISMIPNGLNAKEMKFPLHE